MVQILGKQMIFLANISQYLHVLTMDFHLSLKKDFEEKKIKIVCVKIIASHFSSESVRNPTLYEC